MLQPHPENRGFVWNDHAGPFRTVTAEQAAAFDRDGFFVLRGALDAALVAAIEAEIDPRERAAEEALRREHGGKMGGGGAGEIVRAGEITFTHGLAVQHDRLRRLVSQPPLVDLAIDLIGPDVRLYFDQSVYKKPAQNPRPFPWHQDNGYLFIEPQDYLTCWIPLTDATIDNGCPWIWPGVHRHGTLLHRASSIGYVCKEDDEEAVPVEVEAGDVVVFSSLTPHRTGPNTTGDIRKAYIVQYAHADARKSDGTPCAEPFQFVVARNGEPVGSVS